MKMKTNLFIASSIMAIAVLGSISAQAQLEGASEANELTAVFACRAETDSLKRLACYDAAVGRFEEAQVKGDIVTISKKQVEEVEKDSFGFNLPSIPKLGSLFGSNKAKSPKPVKSKDNPLTSAVEVTKSAERPEIPKEINSKPVEKEEIKEIEATIRSTQTFGYKKTRFFLENGQVWEQIDTRNVRVPKTRNGIAPTVVIQKASLGSFLLRVNGKGSAVRVKRVR